ncbi:hypothetical protein WISP_129825 [Willisornis vidua]|uniref:Uncharacterized protein n=1 Tax=Willisornis vidua TaxID=1566151 RepID=A0ABQ9CVG6_9PASS|nr:hypothetical protein WISP_129825 [Willisornis vidua]
MQLFLPPSEKPLRCLRFISPAGLPLNQHTYNLVEISIVWLERQEEIYPDNCGTGFSTPIKCKENLLGDCDLDAVQAQRNDKGSNLGMLEGFTPVDWKLADLVPVFKEGKEDEPGNDRHVNLTSMTGLKGILNDFADDTKLRGSVEFLKDREVLQKDPEKLKDWAITNTGS